MLTTNQVISLLTTFAPWIGAILAVLWSYLSTIAPWLKDKRIGAVADMVVKAMQQTTIGSAQRFADADAALAKRFPKLSAEERQLWIEGMVATNKLVSGTATFDQLPPTPAQQAQDAQTAQTIQQMQQDIAGLGNLLQQISATQPATLPAPSAAPTAKLNRSAKGQFAAGQPVTPTTAPLTVSGVVAPDSAEKGQ